MSGDADLTIEAFVILREHFFDQNGTPKPFPLREKRNTQDNPLDEYICGVLCNHLQPVFRTPGNRNSDCTDHS
ncbi:MAG: hypothetical protein ACE5OS_15330, partial [Anaerolineae bacterium]